MTCAEQVILLAHVAVMQCRRREADRVDAFFSHGMMCQKLKPFVMKMNFSLLENGLERWRDGQDLPQTFP